MRSTDSRPPSATTAVSVATQESGYIRHHYHVGPVGAVQRATEQVVKHKPRPQNVGLRPLINEPLKHGIKTTEVDPFDRSFSVLPLHRFVRQLSGNLPLQSNGPTLIATEITDFVINPPAWAGI